MSTDARSFWRSTLAAVPVWSVGGVMGRSIADGLIVMRPSWLVLSGFLMAWGALLAGIHRWLIGVIWPQEADVSREDYQRLQSVSDNHWKLYKLVSDQQSGLWDRLAKSEHRAQRAERMVREAYAQGVRDGANAATRDVGR